MSEITFFPTESLFNGKDEIGLVGFAYVYIFYGHHGSIDTDDSVCLFEMTLKPPEYMELTGWYVIVATASGLLILSCVIFALWKASVY